MKRSRFGGPQSSTAVRTMGHWVVSSRVFIHRLESDSGNINDDTIIHRSCHRRVRHHRHHRRRRCRRRRRRRRIRKYL